MNTKRAPLALLLGCLLVLSGCPTSQVISKLQIALDAITAALPILGSVTGVPPAVVTAAEDYVTATNTALGQATTILSGPGTDAEKAAQIAAAFAAVAKPIIPAQYAAIVSLVATIAGDVAQFLASVPASAPAVAQTAAAHTTTWSSGDKEKLAKAQVVATSNGVKLAALRAK